MVITMYLILKKRPRRLHDVEYIWLGTFWLVRAIREGAYVETENTRHSFDGQWHEVEKSHGKVQLQDVRERSEVEKGTEIQMRQAQV